MIVDNVKPTPIELWKWGIKNRSGKLRVVHPDIMKFYLMPRGVARITAKGIRFEKCCIAVTRQYNNHGLLQQEQRKVGKWMLLMILEI